ncbi:MAG TPA: hypothetical protein VFL93_08895 [Longimicrobiaceae bacterium]|nr:hypothetical protein [Longimicrobiaceae bacterium]
MKLFSVDRSESNDVVVDLSHGLNAHYLGGGEATWAISAGDVGLGIITDAQLRGAHGYTNSEPQTMSVLAVRDACTKIVKEIFGERAFIDSTKITDPETGDPETVLVAHYCFTGGADRAAELERMHRQFRRRYVREVPPEVRSRLALTSVATEDGD